MSYSTHIKLRACIAISFVCAVSAIANLNTAANDEQKSQGSTEQTRRVLAHPPPFVVLIRDVDADREIEADGQGGHSYLSGSSEQLIGEPWRLGVAAGGGHRSPDGRNEHKFVVTYMGSLGHLRSLPEVMGGFRFSQDGSRSGEMRMDVYVLSFYERRGDGWEDSADVAVIYKGEEQVLYVSVRSYIRLGPDRMRGNERAEAIALIREQARGAERERGKGDMGPVPSTRE